METNILPETALIDTHAHLHAVEPAKGVIEKAKAVGVERIIAVGMDLDSNLKNLELARQFPQTVYPAIGYHPWSIKDNEIEDTLSFIDANLERCWAVGEVGLDYKVKIKKDLQRQVFSNVLRLAKKWGKPVIVHSRFSHARTYDMVSEAGIEKVVFHWFSGPLEILERIIQAGYYVSATPALGYSPYHQAAISKAPLKRILIETDAPVEYQGKISEPANLTDTLRALCRVKEQSADVLARITTENAQRFFGI